jgi:hypothetical protein
MTSSGFRSERAFRIGACSSPHGCRRRASWPATSPDRPSRGLEYRHRGGPNARGAGAGPDPVSPQASTDRSSPKRGRYPAPANTSAGRLSPNGDGRHSTIEAGTTRPAAIKKRRKWRIAVHIVFPSARGCFAARWTTNVRIDAPYSRAAQPPGSEGRRRSHAHTAAAFGPGARAACCIQA